LRARFPDGSGPQAIDRIAAGIPAAQDPSSENHTTVLARAHELLDQSIKRKFEKIRALENKQSHRSPRWN